MHGNIKINHDIEPSGNQINAMSFIAATNLIITSIDSGGVGVKRVKGTGQLLARKIALKNTSKKIYE